MGFFFVLITYGPLSNLRKYERTFWEFQLVSILTRCTKFENFRNSDFRVINQAKVDFASISLKTLH